MIHGKKITAANSLTRLLISVVAYFKT